jgi:nucleotide-binding universal stress UspA family protein
MRSLRTILLATDLFHTGNEVLSIAARLSQVFGAQIHLLHVVKDHPDLHVADFPMFQRATDQLLAVKNQLIGLGADAVGLPVEFGNPAHVIRSHADSLDVDLIVIGSGEHLSDGLSLVGPIAESVVQHVRQPVLAVYPDTTLESLSRILCPVDYSATSKRGLQNAIRLAKGLGSELIVLTVVPEVSWLSSVMESGELRHAAAEHDRRWRHEFGVFLAEVDFENVSWRPLVRTGKPDEQIGLAAADEDVGLIVMGAHGRSGLVQALVGSVTRGVLQILPCSILTVKNANIIDEIPTNDERTVELLFVEGEALLEVKSYEAAVAKFDQLLAHNPFHVGGLLGRAEALEQLGDSDHAERSRQQATALQMPCEPVA